ncbi:hypothetical protein [Rhodothermus profundi]|uniref:Uncharacterized protein n=1 Tax=Rhodothermus profundi TaxID=633813 RepID=A0A1M6QJE9_9BACT|nr:hypothetical protein [Rhodothermus profundi]SHK20362.1 hypothetical protein SAMN04488087_0648 [Rhodothermus profundi]
MKRLAKLMMLLAIPALLAGGSLALTGCSSDALTGPVVMESGGNNGGGSTTIGGDHNNYGGNNGGGSTTIGGDHNN